jgi:hypothetical protein
MRKVLDIIDGDEYYGVQYPRSSNGDLYGVGDNDLDFCYMWKLRRYCGY